MQVRGYYRKDGTYVAPYTRSAPASKSYSAGTSRIVTPNVSSGVRPYVPTTSSTTSTALAVAAHVLRGVQRVHEFDVTDTGQFFVALEWAEGATLREVLDAGGWPVLLTHWQSLFSNGLETGLAALDELGRRVREHLSDRVEWMTCSEIAGLTARGRIA